MKTAQELGIEAGDIMVTGKGVKVEVISTERVALTQNQIVVKEIGDKHTFYICADSLKWPCDFCEGSGEREVNIDGADCVCECSFCNATGISDTQTAPLTAYEMAVKYLREVYCIEPGDIDLNLDANIEEVERLAKKFNLTKINDFSFEMACRTLKHTEINIIKK